MPCAGRDAAHPAGDAENLSERHALRDMAWHDSHPRRLRPRRTHGNFAQMWCVGGAHGLGRVTPQEAQTHTSRIKKASVTADRNTHRPDFHPSGSQSDRARSEGCQFNPRTRYLADLSLRKLHLLCLPRESSRSDRCHGPATAAIHRYHDSDRTIPTVTCPRTVVVLPCWHAGRRVHAPKSHDMPVVT